MHPLHDATSNPADQIPLYPARPSDRVPTPQVGKQGPGLLERMLMKVFTKNKPQPVAPLPRGPHDLLAPTCDHNGKKLLEERQKRKATQQAQQATAARPRIGRVMYEMVVDPVTKVATCRRVPQDAPSQL